MKKSDRQAIIEKLIDENRIGTQNELLALLNANGVYATQATVSRDIKEMQVVKQNTSDGGYKYIIPRTKDNSPADKRYMTLLLGAVEKTDIALNTVVVKCHTGAAQAAAAALENIALTGVAGTIAGDDTMFILCYTEAEARLTKNMLDEMFGF